MLHSTYHWTYCNFIRADCTVYKDGWIQSATQLWRLQFNNSVDWSRQLIDTVHLPWQKQRGQIPSINITATVIFTRRYLQKYRRTHVYGTTPCHTITYRTAPCTMARRHNSSYTKGSMLSQPELQWRNRSACGTYKTVTCRVMLRLWVGASPGAENFSINFPRGLKKSSLSKQQHCNTKKHNCEYIYNIILTSACSYWYPKMINIKTRKTFSHLLVGKLSGSYRLTDRGTDCWWLW